MGWVYIRGGNSNSSDFNMGILDWQKGEKMKQAKKLTRSQKEIVSNNNLNPNSWMFVSASDFYLKIIHKKSGNIRNIEKYAIKKK